jgi:hypothetical protein
MTSGAKTQPEAPLAPGEPKSGRGWLLFVHQLPSTPSNLRVRTWRRLQQLGALPVKQAVYVLPDTPDTREDLEWLKTEIKAANGDASVFAARNVDSWSDDALVEEFRRARQEAYGSLAREIERVLGRLAAARRPRGTRAPAARRLVEVFRERLSAIERVDFFGSAGRDRVTTVLRQLEEKASDSPPRVERSRMAGSVDAQHYANRLWVTRPRPGVDRMASAWLIKRFVDPQARFAFVADHESAPQNAVPFDMFGVEFSHQNEGCTFETLCAVFSIQEPAVARLAAIVHDLDLKDGRFGAPEAPTVGTVIEGMQLSVLEDDALLDQGMALFESLYRSFERSARSAGPRSGARSGTRAPTSGGNDAPRRRRRG